jgi:hypothetical protein
MFSRKRPSRTATELEATTILRLLGASADEAEVHREKVWVDPADADRGRLLSQSRPEVLLQ